MCHSHKSYRMFKVNRILFFLQKEEYLGILVGKDNYWKGHGIQCMLVPTNSSFADDDYGNELLINDGESELVELDTETCLISYTLIETVHAAVYMFIAVSKVLG